MIDVGLTSLQIDDYFSDSYAKKMLKILHPFSGNNGKCHIVLCSNYNTKQVKNDKEGAKHKPEPHFGPFTYWNRGGLVNVNPDMPVPQKDCHFPSEQMYIKWDGGALLCCCDWEYMVEHGNVLETSLEQVWTNKSYQHYRKTLKKGRRDKLKMCRKCNKGSFDRESDRLKALKN